MSGSGGGRRNPPEEHQFKKGRSGNPKGRPRKPLRAHVPNQIHKDMLEVLGKKIKRPGTEEEMTIMQAYLYSVAINAIKGKAYSMKLFYQLMDAGLHHNIRVRPELNWFANSEKLRRAGEPETDIERKLMRFIAKRSMKPW
jgi:hypothetical protein